ncbi:MAG: hypothetical protein AAB503_00580 [Patescibacteria group bacterium]
MKAEELKPNSWFKWVGDWRVFQCLPGEIIILEGKRAVPVKPLQPTVNIPGGYIPADDEVTLFKESFIRLN